MAYKIETERLLSFLASKRDVYVTEVLAVARDFKEEQLTEEVYGKEDVDAMFSLFVERIKGRIAKDLETTAAMAALMLEQALHAAETAGVGLNIDLAQVENEGALQQLRESTTAAGALRQGGGGGAMTGPGARLTSLGKEHARILQDKDRLELETTALRANVAQLQARYDSTSRELTETRSQLSTLQQQYNTARAASAAASTSSASSTAQQQSAASAELQAQIAQLSSTLERTRVELASAVRERDSKLGESKQFEQLRGLMAKKNGQLAALRAKVAQYEPEWDGETDG